MLPKIEVLEVILFVRYCGDLLLMVVVVLQTTEVGNSVLEMSVTCEVDNLYKLFYLQCLFFTKNFLKLFR